MGSNSKQAQAIVLFIAGFVLLGRGIVGGSIIYFILAIAALALSIVMFRRAKPLESEEAKGA
jgi:hypothetical protein